MGDLGFLNAAIGARLAAKGSAYPNVPAAITAIIIIIISSSKEAWSAIVLVPGQ